MINFTLKDSFYYREGEYEILKNSETSSTVSIKLATENNKAVVYLKDFTGKVEKVAEFENPTEKEKEMFFDNQFNYWLTLFMEFMNQNNISEMLDSPINCSFDYYYKHSIHTNAPRYKVTIYSENGNIYFSVPDENVKVFLTKETKVNGILYLDMLIKKAAINYDFQLTENL